MLQQSLNEVNGLQKSADDSAQRLISGENKDVHGTMIAMQRQVYRLTWLWRSETR